MTELGSSLIEEGMEKGIVEGENKKTIESVKKCYKKSLRLLTILLNGNQIELTVNTL